MIDQEVAEWLAGLIQQTLSELESSPGLTIEVDSDPANWVQVIPIRGGGHNQLSGFVLNLPFRAATDDPLTFFSSLDITLPPLFEITSWQHGSHLSLWLAPSIDLVTLALLVGEFLVKVGKAANDLEINVQILHGL